MAPASTAPTWTATWRSGSLPGPGRDLPTADQLTAIPGEAQAPRSPCPASTATGQTRPPGRPSPAPAQPRPPSKQPAKRQPAPTANPDRRLPTATAIAAATVTVT